MLGKGVSGATYMVRGADCTAPRKEMARVVRWKKLLLNIMIIAVFLLDVFVLGIGGLSDEVR